jgi:RNA polymerase-binding transcription factor DksA
MEPETVMPSDAASQSGAPAEPTGAALDLDAIERDLADVEVALARLDTGTYWTDEVTGQQIDESWLLEHPTARRAEG